MKTLRSILLFGLTAHIVAVCPHDHDLESPVCSTLSDAQTGFKHYVLEPYIQPQVDKILGHPSVARVYEPIAGHVTTIADYAIPHARALSLQYNVVYSQYWDAGDKKFHQHADPYLERYHQYYNAHITPLVETYFTPAKLRLDSYGRIVGMYAEPYIYQAAFHLQELEKKVEPYAIVAWGYVSDAPNYVLKHGWEPLMDARRAYVDPPISKIMEAVEDVSTEVKSTASKLETSFMANAAETPDGQTAFDAEEVIEEEVYVK